MSRPKRECPICGEETTWTNYYEHSYEINPTWSKIETDDEFVLPLLNVDEENLKIIRQSGNTEIDMCDSCGGVIS